MNTDPQVTWKTPGAVLVEFVGGPWDGQHLVIVGPRPPITVPGHDDGFYFARGDWKSTPFRYLYDWTVKR
jgi:hypothetical protein